MLFVDTYLNQHPAPAYRPDQDREVVGQERNGQQGQVRAADLAPHVRHIDVKPAHDEEYDKCRQTERHERSRLQESFAQRFGRRLRPFFRINRLWRFVAIAQCSHRPFLVARSLCPVNNRGDDLRPIGLSISTATVAWIPSTYRLKGEWHRILWLRLDAVPLRFGIMSARVLRATKDGEGTRPIAPSLAAVPMRSVLGPQ